MTTLSQYFEMSDQFELSNLVTSNAQLKTL
jgi:hypothetical protein